MDATDASEMTEELGFIQHYLDKLGYKNEVTETKVFDDNCFLFE